MLVREEGTFVNVPPELESMRGSKVVSVIDGVFCKTTIFDRYGKVVENYVEPIGANNNAKHPLFAYAELDGESYSQVEERTLSLEEVAKISPVTTNGEKGPMDVYILRGKREGYDVETWVSRDTLRIVNSFTMVGPELRTQMKDFKYKEIGDGIFYPVSRTSVSLRESWRPTISFSVSSVELNVYVPHELFTFDSTGGSSK
jgi:hypothetical protein